VKERRDGVNNRCILVALGEGRIATLICRRGLAHRAGAAGPYRLLSVSRRGDSRYCTIDVQFFRTLGAILPEVTQKTTRKPVGTASVRVQQRTSQIFIFIFIFISILILLLIVIPSPD